MSADLKDMLERTGWTFIEAFIGALTVLPWSVLTQKLYNLLLLPVVVQL